MERGRNEFGKYLQRVFVERFTPYYFNKYGLSPDDHDFAEYLGLSDQAYSQYKLGKRRATLTVAEQIVDILKDPHVFDVLGYPRRMPQDPLSIMFVDNVHLLDDSDKEEIKSLILRKQQEQEAKKKRNNTASFA